MMTEPTNYIDDLIVRFFTDDLTADERLELDNWKVESPDNHAHFEQLEEIWFSVANPDAAGRFHKERAYIEFLKRVAVARKVERSRGRRWPILLKYAAVAVLTVGLFPYLFYNIDRQGLLSAFTNIYVEAPLGSTTKMLLPDGTQVWLNAGSKVSYSQGFGVENRNVSLTGEGYFEVTKNKQLPFTVNSNNLSVRVLGTKFNFRDYATDDEVVVDLAEGSVVLDVADYSDRHYQLRPNQRAVFSKTSRQVYIGDCVATNASQWTDGAIVLDGKSMKDIALQLSRSYNADVEITNQRAASMHFYGSFTRRSQSLKDVLDALSSTGKIRYRMVDERKAIVY